MRRDAPHAILVRVLSRRATSPINCEFEMQDQEKGFYWWKFASIFAYLGDAEPQV